MPGLGSLCKNTYSLHSRHNSAPSSILCSAYGVNFNVLTYNTIHTNTKYYTRQMRLSYGCCGKHNFEFPDFGAFNLNHNVTLTSVLHFISQFRRIASAPSPVCIGKKVQADWDSRHSPTTGLPQAQSSPTWLGLPVPGERAEEGVRHAGHL